MYYARINTDTFTGYISDKLTTVNSYLSSLDTKLTTVVSKLGTIDTCLSSISSNLTDKLSTISSSLSSFSTAAVGYFDSQVYSDLPTMFSRMGHDYYYGSTDERTAISAAFDRYWLTSMSSGKSYVSPEVLDSICADLNKANIRCSVYYDADLGLSYIKGLGGPYVSDPSDWVPSGAAFEALSTNGRILAIRDLAIVSSTRSVSYYVSNMLTKVGSVDDRLSTLHSDATSLGTKLDTIISLQTTNTYICGTLTIADGTAREQLSLPYDTATAICARLNTQLMGKKITAILRDGSTTSVTFDRCSIDSRGLIRVHTAASDYYLCSPAQVILKTDVSAPSGGSSSVNLSVLETTAAKIENTLSIINDKLDDTATKIENTTVNITNNNPAYNVFYVTDEDGNEHSITSVAGDSLSASGKLLQFLYKLVVNGALSGVDSAVDNLDDFFFDGNPSGLGEGVSVWD